MNITNYFWTDKCAYLDTYDDLITTSRGLSTESFHMSTGITTLGIFVVTKRDDDKKLYYEVRHTDRFDRYFKEEYTSIDSDDIVPVLEALILGNLSINYIFTLAKFDQRVTSNMECKIAQYFFKDIFRDIDILTDDKEFKAKGEEYQIGIMAKAAACAEYQSIGIDRIRAFAFDMGRNTIMRDLNKLWSHVLLTFANKYDTKSKIRGDTINTLVVTFRFVMRCITIANALNRMSDDEAIRTLARERANAAIEAFASIALLDAVVGDEEGNPTNTFKTITLSIQCNYDDLIHEYMKCADDTKLLFK